MIAPLAGRRAAGPARGRRRARAGSGTAGRPRGYCVRRGCRRRRLELTAQLLSTSNRNMSARTPPRSASHGSEVHVRVDVDADVAERRREVGVGEVRSRWSGGHVAVLRRRGLIDAREVARPRPPAAGRGRSPCQRAKPRPPNVSSPKWKSIMSPRWRVRRLRRLLDVVQEAGPVLEQAHRPVDDEELLRDVHVA